MVNTINTLIERNKELLNKIEELKNREKVEISREAQLKIIEKIEKWKKENHEVGTRLKKYQGNTYPSFIANSDWPVWKSLACDVNFELNLVQYLHKEENPLDALLEMMLDSITRKVISSRNLEGLKDKEVEEKWKLKEEVKELKHSKEIISQNYDSLNRENSKDKEKLEKLEKELEEKELTIEYLEQESEELKLGLEANLDAIKLAEVWEMRKRKKVEDELNSKSETLHEFIGKLAEKIVETEKLQKQLKESREEILEKTKQNRELQMQIYLDNKQKQPLPNLPSKKSSKFKTLTKSLTTKLRKLVTKRETLKQKQEMVARIEVKVN